MNQDDSARRLAELGGTQPDLVVPPRHRSAARYDEWVRMGLVKPATGRIGHAPQASTPRAIEDILEADAGDH